jgi:hypothetical protein
MDVATYAAVLEHKLKRKPSMLKKANCGFTETELALRQDMAALKVVWYNSFFKDWWWCARADLHTCLPVQRPAPRPTLARIRPPPALTRSSRPPLRRTRRTRRCRPGSFMRNTHPVMATCLSHSLHSVSKRKRFFVYYMLIGALFARAVTVRLGRAAAAAARPRARPRTCPSAWERTWRARELAHACPLAELCSPLVPAHARMSALRA